MTRAEREAEILAIGVSEREHFERVKAELAEMSKPYDDPEQLPSAVYTICHNDDDYRRVRIEVFLRPVGDYEVFADGEPLEGNSGVCETLAEARYVIEQLWHGEAWDLRTARAADDAI